MKSKIDDLARRRARRRMLRICAGLLVVGAVAWAVRWGFEREFAAHTVEVVRSLRTACLAPRQHVPLGGAVAGAVQHGDPVFVMTDSGQLELMGRVLSSGDEARVDLRPGAPELGADASLELYRSDQAMAWVVRTMLPPAKQDRLRTLIRDAYAAHGAEVTAALEPVVRASVKDALAAIQAELPAVLRAHREELQALGVAYQDELVKDELLPMAQEQLFPLVEERARPLLTEVGREIWERVSLWRVGSRYLWDRLPLTSGTSLEAEWQRVLKEEALPVMRQHAGAFVDLLREVLAAAARNPEVRASLRRVYGKVVDDPRVQELIGSMFRQAVVDNQGLRDALAERWRSERARAAMKLVERRFQPTAQKVGEILFGVRGEGIAPEFAVVLRNRLLLKDRRWLVLLPGDAGRGDPPKTLTVVLGERGFDPFQPRDPSAGEGR